MADTNGATVAGVTAVFDANTTGLDSKLQKSEVAVDSFAKKVGESDKALDEHGKRAKEAGDLQEAFGEQVQDATNDIAAQIVGFA